MNEFLQRLKQRKLVQWTLAYVAAAFALLQGIDIVAQRFGWPEQTMRFVIIALSVGLFVTLVLAWYHGERGAQRINGTELLILALLLAIGGGFLWRFGGAARGPAVIFAPAPAAMPATSISEKSIAVLPFENLSSDKENAYFTDGVQDEILTDLAKIADLKVISRTSVMQYKSGAARNLREIGQQLGVAHLLEGSVQRATNKVRVNAQLINARTDAHEWAENYDRPLDDVFAIQSDIAKAIADQLQAKIAAPQLEQIDRRPTNNLQAYDAYLRGLTYARRSYDVSASDIAEQVKYFREAVRLDPAFADAWAWLGRTLSYSYFNDEAKSAATLEAAREATKKAFELQPASAEANLAQGYLAYHGEDNYEAATGWFEKALKLAPNDSETYEALGLLSRRKGKWQEGASYLGHAAELNPRNNRFLGAQAVTLSALKEYPTLLKVCDTMLSIAPDDKWALSFKIGAYQDMGDLPSAASLLPPHPEDSSLFQAQVVQWVFERRYSEGIAALTVALRKPIPPGESVRRDYLGDLALLYYISGDQSAARSTGRQLLEDILAHDKGPMLIRDDPFWLTFAYSVVGDKAKAIAAAEPQRTSKDASVAAYYSATIAYIGVLTSDKEMALSNLALAAQTPGSSISFGDLRNNPAWDPLRHDPRFEKIVASLAPKDLAAPSK